MLSALSKRVVSAYNRLFLSVLKMARLLSQTHTRQVIIPLDSCRVLQKVNHAE